MNIFDIFTKKHSDGQALTVAFPTAATAEAEEQVESAIAQEEKKPLTVSYATGWPIDVVYGYLHKNYEGNGFEDAMVKSDMAFKDMNMKLIRNKILMVFREINLNYDVMKQDVKIRIDNCREAGLFTTVAELDKKIQLIDNQILDWTKKKLNVEEDTRAECKANVGFLEELEAMVSIIFSRRVAGVFYMVFFLLLISLELFVVVSKMGDKECDYEVAVKAAERIRMERMNLTFGRMAHSNPTI